jgi:hypothetical protein
MSASVKDLFNYVESLYKTSGAREYISSNANLISEKVISVARPYKGVVTDNIQFARGFVGSKVTEVRSAESIGAVVDILVGILLTLIRIALSVVESVRRKVSSKVSGRFSGVYHKSEALLRRLSNKVVGFPNSPVVKKVEGVSKKVLGDSRHDQAVDFIKSNVEKVYEKFVPMKSPSGSSTADLTTEGGSVTGSSPRDTGSRKGQKSRQRK